jgi:16S rRNA (guanine527-N7)-methyltransferase
VSSAAFFEGESLEAAIADRARRSGIELDSAACAALATHARSVLAANERLHLTTIEAPDEFLERHVGEAFEGAALVGERVDGLHVDLGTGGGFPAIPFLIARSRLRSLLVEASHKKAEFLRRAVDTCGLSARAQVLERQVQRADDLAEASAIAVLTVRAVGGWSKLVPKLASLLSADGVALVWAGEDVEQVRHREVWKRLELVKRHPLPAMERAAIWEFRRSHS